MKRLVDKIFYALFLSSAVICLGQENVVIDYHGRLRVEGAPFSGVGNFAFSLENTNGEIVWSSGDFPFVGGSVNPTNAVKANVTGGEYSVRLGAANLGMPPINLAQLRRMQHPRLKIWFNDGTHHWQRAGDDVPLDPLIASLETGGRQPMTISQGDAIIQELRSVRTLLGQQNHVGQQPAPQAAPPPAYATVALDGPSLGQSNAPLVLVEFTDYQCPFCKRFQENVFPDLVKKYVDGGKLRIISRNLPLPFHQYAEPAAKAAICAEEQGKYWAMREKLFGKNGDLTASNLVAAAEAASLDAGKFKACLDATNLLEKVKKDGTDAGGAGITGTPSFVLGKPNGDKVNGLIIVGAQPIAAFEAEIQKLLATVK